MSQRSFARAIGLRHPSVNRMIKGHVGPPLKHLEQWITVLKLEGEAAAEFRVAAWLANAPVELGEYVARLHRVAKQLNPERQ